VKAWHALLGLLAGLGLVFGIALPARAATYGGGNVQGYAAESAIDTGTIVQLSGKDAKEVKVATQPELQNMFGVTVDGSQLPFKITNQKLKNEVFVAVSGTYNVLVSTQNGSIKPGDYVTLSSINGVAMKADTEQKTVFGRAHGSFDGKGVTRGSATLKDTKGATTKKVTLGMVPVTIRP
jgi:hypothetical protein